MSYSGGGHRRPSHTHRFEGVFRATYPRVLAYALRRTADRGSAEEVVSETYLIAWRRHDALPEEPLPWLLGIARRVLANQRRSVSRRQPDGAPASLDLVEAPHPELTPYETVAEREAFASAFGRLSERDREVLSLIAWDGLKPREAAEVMRCSAAVFSLRLHRARRRLLKELGTSGHSLGQETRTSPLDERPGIKEAP
jgi:RNA polymerase sigma-70 factor (ECF subfamily)